MNTEKRGTMISSIIYSSELDELLEEYGFVILNMDTEKRRAFRERLGEDYTYFKKDGGWGEEFCISKSS